MTKKRKDFAVTIMWGESPEDGQVATTYRFKTQAELIAFKDGINEASGWLGSAEVREGDVWCGDCDEAHAPKQCRTMHACDSCGEEWYDSQLVEAKRLSERVDPGGPMPSGECPDCGCLCYPVAETCPDCGGHGAIPRCGNCKVSAEDDADV